MIKLMPRLKNTASDKDLQSLFEGQLEQSRKNAAEIEKIFWLLNRKPVSKKCDIVEGIICDGDRIAESLIGSGHAMDTLLVFSSTKAIHCTIAVYSAILRQAMALGATSAARILKVILYNRKRSEELLAAVLNNPTIISDIPDPQSIAKVVAVDFFPRSLPLRAGIVNTYII